MHRTNDVRTKKPNVDTRDLETDKSKVIRKQLTKGVLRMDGMFYWVTPQLFVLDNKTVLKKRLQIVD